MYACIIASVLCLSLVSNFVVDAVMEMLKNAPNFAVRQNCPVSHAINTDISSKYFSYPLETYNLDYLKDVRNGLINDNSLGFCGTIDNIQRKTALFERKTNNTCSTHQNCPVVHENMIILTNISNSMLGDTKGSVSLCKLHDSLLHTNETVNMIVFGGSVTGGYFAHGCSTNHNAKDECVDWRLECTLCAWVSLLGNWFTSTFRNHNPNVHFHNLFVRGMNAIQSEPLVINKLRQARITQLTSNDIIFLDFSTNDNACLIDCSVTIESGLESIIRQLYSYARDLAVEKNMPVTYPTIIILETDPDMKHRYKPILVPYTTSYRKIASSFRLPLWSYRDVVTSNFSVHHQSAFNNHLQYLDAEGNHPPWDIHLFMADLFAVKLLNIFSGCAQWSSERSTQQQEQEVTSHSNLVSHLLESPVFTHINHTRQCNDSAQRVVSLSYSILVAVNAKQPHPPIVGAYLSYPVGSWLVREDVRGRGGFISELGVKDSGSVGSNSLSRVAAASEDVARFKANTIPGHSKLIFTLAGVNRSQIVLNKMTFAVDLEYLRTYHNAGVVSLKFCDTAVPMPVGHTHLDALWSNYAQYRYSLPQTFTVVLSYLNCLKSGISEPIVTVEVIHEPINMSTLRNPALVAARDKQKFKINSIDVCVL